MQSILTIGLDIAKSVFQVHGVDAAGQAVLRRQLRGRHVLAFFQKLSPSLVGIEACASRLPEVARTCLAALGSQLRALKAQILEFDRRIMVWHRSNATSKRCDQRLDLGAAQRPGSQKRRRAAGPDI